MSAATAPISPGTTCASCGRAIARDETYSLTADRRAVCNDCAATAPGAAPVDPLASILAGRPASFVRSYRAGDQDEAARDLEAETRRLADAGYRLRAQSWAPAERPFVTGVFGVGVTLVGLFFLVLVTGGFFVGLLIGLLGLAILAAYAGNIRPAMLTATFEVQPEAVPAPGAGQRPAAERLRELESLRSEDLISDEELATRRAAVIDSI
jgi:hypothetical protein